MGKILNVGHRLGNLNEIPEELRLQIPEFNLGGLDERCYKVLKEDLGGVASLSEIMIAHYNHFKTFDTRKSFVDAIYRLIRKKLVVKVEKMKSVYRLVEKNEV